MKVNDAVGGGVLLTLAVGIALYARTLPSIPGQQYGAGAFPLVVAAGLGGCGVWLILQGLRVRATEPWFEPPEWLREPHAILNLVATIGFVLLYIFFGNTIGFIPISLGMLFCLFVLLGARPLPAAATAVVATLVIHTAFYKLLRVPLPWGILESVAW
jgi:putative tricarboxylic transport membrane protein